MPFAIQPPNVPEADLLMPRRAWVRFFGWTWAVMILITLVVAVVDGLIR